MKRLILTGILIGLSLALAACGSATAPAPASSKPVIKVETNPNPAVRGDVELRLTLTDGSGNPIEGARVDVSADHTEMSGMSMGGAATEQGGGKYSIKANFSMSGTWQLTVYVRKDALDYKEEIELPVQ